MQPSSQSHTLDGVPVATADVDTVAAALGRIPSGLFIVTWRADDRDRGMLASWVMQAGFTPAALSVAIAAGRDLLTWVARGEPFVVNVLAESQRAVAGRFAKPIAEGTDPFAGLPLERTPAGLAGFADAAAWLECRPVAGAEPAAAADHAVVVARVLAARGDAERQPLVHLRRSGLRY